jgi:hypothetical protein
MDSGSRQGSNQGQDVGAMSPLPPADDAPNKTSKGTRGRPKGRSFTKMIAIKLTDDERERLDWVCDKRGSGISELFREWMNREVAELEDVLKEKSVET